MTQLSYMKLISLCVEDESKRSASKRGPVSVEFGQTGNPGKAVGLRLEVRRRDMGRTGQGLSERSCDPGLTLVAVYKVADLGI